jgi:hypothetical protein
MSSSRRLKYAAARSAPSARRTFCRSAADCSELARAAACVLRSRPNRSNSQAAVKLRVKSSWTVEKLGAL